MTFMITGGTGFIGSYIARGLVRNGEDVVLYDSLPNERFLKSLLTGEEQEKPLIIQGDVLDFGHLLRTVKEYGIDTIIHMAYLLSEGSNTNPSLAIKVNCEGTNNVLEAIRLLSPRTRLVFTSSCSALGPSSKHDREYLPDDAPQFPNDIYGATKSFIERMAEFYFDRFGVDSIGLRFGVVYGTGMRLSRGSALIQELIVNPAVGKPGNVPFGDDTVNWLYVEDAVRVVLLACQASQTRTRVFNVSGDVRPVKEVAEYVRKLIPDAKLTLQPGYLGRCFKYETRSLKKEIGYEPAFLIEQGVKNTVDSVRQQHRISTS